MFDKWLYDWLLSYDLLDVQKKKKLSYVNDFNISKHCILSQNKKLVYVAFSLAFGYLVRSTSFFSK